MGPDSSRIGNVQSSRRIDDTFLDDQSSVTFIIIDGTSAKGFAVDGDDVLSLCQLDPRIPRWCSFDSWSDSRERPEAPNGLTHYHWTERFELFRSMVEAHHLGFKEFVERRRRKGQSGYGSSYSDRRWVESVRRVQEKPAATLVMCIHRRSISDTNPGVSYLAWLGILSHHWWWHACDGKGMISLFFSCHVL